MKREECGGGLPYCYAQYREPGKHICERCGFKQTCFAHTNSSMPVYERYRVAEREGIIRRGESLNDW